MSNLTPTLRFAPIFGISKERAMEIESGLKEADGITTTNPNLGLMQIWDIGKKIAQTPEECALIGMLLGSFAEQVLVS